MKKDAYNVTRLSNNVKSESNSNSTSAFAWLLLPSELSGRKGGRGRSDLHHKYSRWPKENANDCE